MSRLALLLRRERRKQASSLLCCPSCVPIKDTARTDGPSFSAGGTWQDDGALTPFCASARPHPRVDWRAWSGDRVCLSTLSCVACAPLAACRASEADDRFAVRPSARAPAEPRVRIAERRREGGEPDVGHTFRRWPRSDAATFGMLAVSGIGRACIAYRSMAGGRWPAGALPWISSPETAAWLPVAVAASVSAVVACRREAGYREGRACCNTRRLIRSWRRSG